MNQFNAIQFINSLRVSRSIREQLEVYINSEEFEEVPFDDLKQAIINEAERLQD
jgi:hypothetical protein